MSKTGRQHNWSIWETAGKACPLCLVVAFACLAIVLAGCSQAGTTASSGASSTESASMSSSADASSTSASEASSGEIDESDFIGSWEVVNMTNPNDDSNDKSITPEDIKAQRKKGLDNYVVLNPDGSAVYVLWGVYLYGTWEIEPDFAERGLGTAAMSRFTAPDGGSMTFITFIEDSKLMLMDGSKNLIECEKVKDKKPLTKDEHDAALEAFVGTWHLQSATRDGVTITRESGQIATDVTLEFKSNMKSTLVNGEKSAEALWGITGINSGYIYNPVDGDKLTISDGVLTEDLGEQGTMSFVKE